MKSSESHKNRIAEYQARTTALENMDQSQKLSEIIQQDFFPDVLKLEKKLAGSSSSAGLVDTPSIRGDTTCKGGTSATGCPSDDVHRDHQTSAAVDIAVGTGQCQQGLDDYLSKHESEDDASFREILDKSREAHQQKYAWLHMKEQQYAALTSSNTLAITQGPVQPTPNQEASGPGFNAWSYTSKNSLMYVPEAREQSTMEVMKETSKKREIVHSNTRLSQDFVTKFQKINTPTPQVKPAAAKEKIGVDGKAECGEGTPQVQGYGFVATPQIQPGIDASPLMTWGTIEGTPQRLDSDLTTTPGPAFKLPKESVREKVALKLADEVVKASRTRKKAIVNASPAMLRNRLGATPSSYQRLHLLSPAARKLIGHRSSKHTDKSLVASYTPKMKVGSTPSHAKQGTPKITNHTTPQTTPHLSDNLLNLQHKHI